MKYIGSKNRIAKELVPIIQSFIDEDTTAYIEPFCLDGETNIYTKYGIKRIKDLKVGDIYKCENENCEMYQENFYTDLQGNLHEDYPC